MILVVFHVAKQRSGHGNFVYLLISVCMMEMKWEAFLGVTVRYKVVNSVSLPLQKGDISIFVLVNEPDHDVGGVSCRQTALST